MTLRAGPLVAALLVSRLLVACGGGAGDPGAADGTGGGADAAAVSDAGRDVGGGDDGAGPTADVPADAVVGRDTPLDDADAPIDPGGECAVGEPDRCAADGRAIERCDHEVWRALRDCDAADVCLGAPPECVRASPCTPGTPGGCRDDENAEVCDPTGVAFVPSPCPDGELCFGGGCRPARCVPGSGLCMSPSSVSRCLEDGQGYGAVDPCPLGTACIEGTCWSECQNDPKFQDSYVGCVFWSTDLGQWHVREGEVNLDGDAAHIPHAVVVGNPGQRDAAVTFEVGDGTPVVIADPIVPAGTVRAFLMPVLSLQDSGVSRKSIRMTSTQPLTAAQFNPPSNADLVHTSDASLLVPAAVLGRVHIAVSGPSVRGLEMPGLGRMPSVFGYFTVVAVRPGLTDVTFTPTVPTEPGPDFPGLPAGEPHTVTLSEWDVLHVQALGGDLLGGETNDLTGTVIRASQDVAVWGGHDCLNIGAGNCDHIETQLAPVVAWGDHYVAARLGTPAPNVYRVVSGADGNVVTTNPPVGGLDGVPLDEGEWVEATVDGSFEVLGTGPIQVVQFIAGNEGGGDFLVDPSMAALVPTRQYRDDYPILVPSDYAVNRVAIARPAGVAIYLDGAALPNSSFRPIFAGAPWETANVAVPEGVARLTGDAPFGLVAYGYDNKVSYAYPAGFDAAPVP